MTRRGGPMGQSGKGRRGSRSEMNQAHRMNIRTTAKKKKKKKKKIENTFDKRLRLPSSGVHAVVGTLKCSSHQRVRRLWPVQGQLIEDKGRVRKAGGLPWFRAFTMLRLMPPINAHSKSKRTHLGRLAASAQRGHQRAAGIHFCDVVLR